MSNHSLWHRDKSLLLNYTQHAILTLFRVAVKTTNGHNITTKVLRQKITRGDTYSMSKLYDSLDYSATVYTQTFLSLKLTMFQQIKRNNSRKRFLFMQAISQYQWMTSSFFSISHCVMDSLWLMQIGYLKEKEKKKVFADHKQTFDLNNCAIDQLHWLFFLCLLGPLLSLPIFPFLQDDIEHAPGWAHMGVRVSNKSITETQQSSEGYGGVECM